jgi:hypothetical protein
VSDFQNYMLQQARREKAYQQYNYASAALENAQIHERLAELKSQHEPLAALAQCRMTERERMYAAAFYAVVGRMPESVSPPPSPAQKGDEHE